MVKGVKDVEEVKASKVSNEYLWWSKGPTRS